MMVMSMVEHSVLPCVSTGEKWSRGVPHPDARFRVRFSASCFWVSISGFQFSARFSVFGFRFSFFGFWVPVFSFRFPVFGMVHHGAEEQGGVRLGIASG